ncbi:YadA-like family protein [Eikenella corrodens]|uniref:YadA-like family protein n=1 Tax=Eikenella corrodens TaxID=539 RepID=UPI00129BA551|nr:YadA-like family protein [Eikenella corrodens]
MNKVYRTVWNEHTNTWVAVQETAKAHGKSGRSSIVAAVVDGISLNKKVLAISASVAAAFMSQTAMADNARIENGSAQWTIAISPSDSTAGNGGAKATGKTSIAAGWDAKADGENSIAVGYGASTETNSATYYRIKNVPDKTMNNIAIGKQARSGGLQTIAFGAESVASKSQSIAFGFDAQATGDQSVALGANTRSMGDSSVAIGGDDLDSVASTVYRATSASADNDAYNDTPLAQTYRALTGQNLVNFTPGNRYIGTTTGQAGVAVGVSAKAADLATAIGTKSHATGDYSVAFGVGANATLANAVALGAGSTTATNATDVPSATIGAITYGSATSPFAGSGKVVPGDQVSVGSAGFERQIKHVAPGAITAASTDAINGSQLFYVAKGLQDQISNNSATRSFGVNADNNSLKTHQLGKELAIVAGNTTEATSTANLKTNVIQDAATGKTTVTVSMKEAPTFSSVTTQDAAGNKTVTNAGGVTITPVSGSPVSLTKDGLNNGGNKITGVADGNIAAGSKEAINGGQLHDLKENGFKIAADNGTADTVKLTETVKYAGDSNIVTTVTDNQIGFKLADSITVGPSTGGNPVKIDGTNGTVTGLTNKTWDPNNITSGRGATEDQLKAAQAAATSKVAAGNGISVTPTVDATTGSTTYTVAADTTALNVGDGNNGNPAGKVITPTGADANKLATAGDIANAINNSGFNIDAGGNVVGSHTATTAKPGSTLTLKAGDGLTVKQELDGNGNQSYTYALDAQTVVQNAQTPVVYTKADGTKVYKRPDGKFYDAATGGNEVATGDVIASMQDADGSTTAPTTLANVKNNLANTATATGNPNGNDRATLAAGNKGNNAATVNDVLNAGFTVQGNGQDKDFVTHGDTINFVNGQGTVAKVNTTNGVTEVKFDTPMTYVNNAGVPTSDPSNKVNLVGGDTNKPVTLGNVADGNIAAGSKEAINGGQLHDLKENGFKIAADNGTADTVKLTETVKYAGDSNIVTTVTDNQIGFKLADSITVGPSTGGNPVKIDGTNGTVTGLTNKTWDPNNITSGRGATEDQLKAAQAAATSKVAAGNGISVTPTVDATTGSTTYTVAADTTALNVGDGNNGNPAGKVITPTGADANKLATAGDIANAINNSGFNIDAGGNVVGSHTATTAKPGSTLTLKAGDGLTVKQELDGNGNQSYTYALDAQTVVQNAQTPVVYTKADGTKVYKRPDGKFYDAATGGNEVATGDVIASMQDADGSTTAPTTLANVKNNLANTATATGNPNGNDRATLAAGNKGNNAATVNDVLNAGFTVQGNGQDKDFVTHGDTINFVNGQGTVAKVNTTNGVTEVKFDTPMTYVNNAGVPTSDPSNKVNLVGDAAGGPVTLGNVAPGTLSATSTEAVNGSQLYATNQNVAKGINFGGTTGSNNYQLGDTINVKGDNNITSTTVTGGAQLALNPNLSVTSVTTTDAAGNQTVTNGGGVTITPAGGGNPVSLTTGGLNNGGNKITNVADGTAGTDAVNVGQLNAALGAINSAGNANIAALDAKINDVADTANAGVAQAIATAGLPQAYLPGKNMVAVGGGYYKGETGYAVGFSTISDSGNWIIKATGSGNSRGNFGASIGAGYQW